MDFLVQSGLALRQGLLVALQLQVQFVLPAFEALGGLVKGREAALQLGAERAAGPQLLFGQLTFARFLPQIGAEPANRLLALAHLLFESSDSGLAEAL